MDVFLKLSAGIMIAVILFQVLSKRDKDLDLGVLRQRLKPEELIGTLAFSAGLIEKNVPVSAAELSAIFRWETLRREDIYLDASSL